MAEITPKERADMAVQALKQEYPDAICSLVYTDPFQLLVATRLAAQCTDARVNLVTPALFARYPTLEAFAEAGLEYHSLTDFDAACEAAAETGYIDRSDIDRLMAFRNSL